jgi:hypothetical protein
MMSKGEWKRWERGTYRAEEGEGDDDELGSDHDDVVVDEVEGWRMKGTAQPCVKTRMRAGRVWCPRSGEET